MKIINFTDAVTVINSKAILKRDYKEKGIFPIVSQEIELINGYTDDSNNVINGDGGLIGFGDHTRTIKYIDFEFVKGADGLKVLKVNKEINPKYFYFWIKSLNLKDLGYARHFKLLKNFDIPVPSLQEQEKIVEKLDKVYENIENKVEKENYKINLYEKLYKSKLNQIFSNEFKKSGETELAKFSEIISGQSPKGEFINNSEGLEFHQGKKAFSGKFLLDSGKRTKHTTKQVPKNTIVMSVRAPVGPVNITQNNICIGRGLAGIIPKNANLDFMFYYLDFIKEKNTGHVGATINSINRNEIMKIKIPNLNIEKQEKVSNKIKEILELKNELASNSNKTLVMLDQLKQSMLNKEFSNE